MSGRHIAVFMAAVAAALSGHVSAQNPAGRTPVPGDSVPRLTDGRPDLRGVWMPPYVPDMTMNRRDQLGYAEPPFSPDDTPQVRQALYAKGNRAELPFTPWGLQDWSSYDAASGDYTGSCFPFGLQRSVNAPYPFQIMQDDRHVAILFEINTWHHVVPIAAEFPKEMSYHPTWYGYSIGRWEGDTFVIETRGFNGYENVHRGQSSASQATTALFEGAYDTIARFLGAPSRKSIVVYRNTTEAHNAVMYSLLTEFRDGDNVVTTMMEHNSNYVPWWAMCNEILPKFGRRVECRLVRFDPQSGELDMQHMASLVDAKTKLVCCTGASNFFGTRNPLASIRALASRSGYVQPNGEQRTYMLVDGAQMVPGTFVDVHALDVEYLSFSCHKMLAPFGTGVLYAKEHLLEQSPPFLYGGDMVADGEVLPDAVTYNALPWKFAAGTPNILGTIVSAQALRLLLDLALTPLTPNYFGADRPLQPQDVEAAMGRVAAWNRALTARALERLAAIPGMTIYGPRDASRRTALVAFNVAGRDPIALARALNDAGVESRAGCHCATLAHHALKLEPLASCRLSFYLYNTLDDVDYAADALAAIVAGRTTRKAACRRLRVRAQTLASRVAV